MGLVSEPVSICGVDVSAPQQFRGQRRSTLDEMLESLGSCFTHNEVFEALKLFQSISYHMQGSMVSNSRQMSSPYLLKVC